MLRAKGEIDAWIAKHKGFEADGLSGHLDNLVGMEQWTATAANYLNIEDMENIDTIEADGLELEDAGPDSDSDSDFLLFGWRTSPQVVSQMLAECPSK
jgi:hypothetical protein